MKATDPRGRWALYASHLGSYMRRWIFRHPKGTVRIHHIQESDAGRDFHDHPFDFTSVILVGGYIEHRPGCTCPPKCAQSPCAVFFAPAIVRRKATDLHRLELIGGFTAWTLVFSSPYYREWGFATPKGWVGYQEYHRSYYKERGP